MTGVAAHTRYLMTMGSDMLPSMPPQRDYHKTSPVPVRLPDDLKSWAQDRANHDPANTRNSLSRVIIEALTRLRETETGTDRPSNPL